MDAQQDAQRRGKEVQHPASLTMEGFTGYVRVRVKGRVGQTSAATIQLVGEIQVETDEGRAREGFLAGRQPRLLFALLVIQRPEALSVDTLVSELWGDAPPRTWSPALRNVVSRVRRFLARAAIDPSALVRSPAGYRLLLPDVVVDVEHAERLVEDGRSALEMGDPSRAAAFARRAEGTLARPFLPGIETPLVDFKRIQLQELLMEALDISAEGYLASGRWREARLAAQRAIRLNPFHESAHRALIRAYSGAGSVADAILTFHRFRRRLQDELGVEPSGQTMDMYLQILRQQPA